MPSPRCPRVGHRGAGRCTEACAAGGRGLACLSRRPGGRACGAAFAGRQDGGGGARSTIARRLVRAERGGRIAGRVIPSARQALGPLGNRYAYGYKSCMGASSRVTHTLCPQVGRPVAMACWRGAHQGPGPLQQALVADRKRSVRDPTESAACGRDPARHRLLTKTINGPLQRAARVRPDRAYGDGRRPAQSFGTKTTRLAV